MAADGSKLMVESLSAAAATTTTTATTPSNEKVEEDDDEEEKKNDKDKSSHHRNDKKSSQKSTKILRRLLGEIPFHAPTLTIGTIAMFTSSYANQALPRLMRRLIDSGSGRSSSSNASCHPGNHLSCYGAAAVVLGGGLASLIRTYTLSMAEASVVQTLRLRAFRYLIRTKDLEWFDEHSNALSVTFQSDTAKMASTCTQSIVNTLRSASSVVFGMYNMVRLNATLFGTAVTIVPVVGATAVMLRKQVKRIQQQQAALDADSASHAQERWTNLKMVRHSNREHDEILQYEQIQERQLEIAHQASIQSGIMMGCMFTCSAAALLLVVRQGSRDVQNHKMTGGELTSFTSYAFLMGLGTSGVLKGLGELMSGLVAAERFYNLLDDGDDNQSNDANNNMNDASEKKTEQEIQCNRTSTTTTAATTLNVDTVESIALDSVRFRYKAHPDHAVLQDVSLKLERGRVVAVLGENGAGKSTLASLLGGLYAPTSGSLTVHCTDGTARDLTALDRNTQKNLIHVIPQTTCLFNMTVTDNVRYCQPDASLFDVRYALTTAKCSDLLLADSDQTVGVAGCKLSGGERQRLALARALLANPAFLVLDEPTIALDQAGTKALEQLVSHDRRGVLLITHNPKTVLELAQEVVVLRDGIIVEQGPVSVLRANPSSALCQLMPTVFASRP
jgi:ABC-type multidrug transport system fused ATPase/permease subunit